MKTILILLVAGAIILPAWAEDPPLGRLPDGTYYLLDEVDFALRAEVAQELSPADGNRRPVDKARLRGLHPAIREIVGGHTSAASWLEGKPLPARLKHTTPDVPILARQIKAKLHRGHDAARVIEQLREHPDVEMAGLNLLHDLALTPNDTRYSDQWAPHRVRADEAWEVPQGSIPVRIAIVDTGVDLTHPDLAGRIVYNKGFGPNANGDAKRDMRGGNSIDHGTHVAGIAAAIRGNNRGIAGIATADIMAMGCAVWNSDAAQYQICCAADAILDAVANDADVINCSFSMASIHRLQDNQTTYIALNQAESQGVIVVCAAGNDTNNVANTPSAGWNDHDWPIIVSNAASNDVLSISSNFGNAIDLAAPGSNILSTVTTNYRPANPDGTYGIMGGTSMASPCVAGAAAVVKSMNPTRLPGDGVKDLLFRMAQDLPPAGKDTMYGYGMVQLNPQFLRTLKGATAFVGPNPWAWPFYRIGDYSYPYTSITEAFDYVGAGATIVLNGGRNGPAEYHYPPQTINTPVTLTALPDRPVIIGR